MMNYSDIRAIAKKVIRNEVQSLNKLEGSIDDHFIQSVETIYQSKGRVIISGIGKSAIIAQKIVATMNSTGTPAIYMHAADAIHGDLGMIMKDDVVMIISKSGESPEIKALIPFVQKFGNPIIAISGNKNGYLARECDHFIDTTIDQEACPNNLAPTTSTTAQLIMGDALAVCLLELKGFTPSDFARYHPGGSLGKQLYLKVNDIVTLNEKPEVDIETGLKQIIMEISGKRMGATAVVHFDDLLGIITDGDVRRMLENDVDISKVKAKDIYNDNPKTIEWDSLAIKALEQMQQNNISQLIVTQQGQYKGMIHLHDLIKEGLV